jgi:type II secretory pathway predicted ATPase ExeA
MEIDVYHQGKKTTCASLQELDEVLSDVFKDGITDTTIITDREKLQPKDLTNLRLLLVVSMLNVDPQLRKLVKVIAKLYL